MTLERQRATMERKESNYVYVVLCIHIAPGAMGSSLGDCVSVYIYVYIERGVLEKNIENFCSSLVLNTVNLTGRESQHVLTPVQGSKIISHYRVIYHIFCRAAIQYHTLGAEKSRFWYGKSYFRIDGWGSSTRVSTGWTKHKQTCHQ